VESPLLETSIKGARAVLLNVMGGYDLGMLEVNEAADFIAKEADEDAIIIFGASIKEEMSEEISVTVIATGFEDVIGRRLVKGEEPEEGDPEAETAEEAGPEEIAAGQIDGASPGREAPYNPNNDFPIPSFLSKEIKF
jgi:cell division protein FtsZ